MSSAEQVSIDVEFNQQQLELLESVRLEHMPDATMGETIHALYIKWCQAEGLTPSDS